MRSKLFDGVKLRLRATYLIHGYFSVDLDIAWSIVQNDLPPLIKQLEEIIAEE